MGLSRSGGRWPNPAIQLIDRSQTQQPQEPLQERAGSNHQLSMAAGSSDAPSTQQLAAHDGGKPADCQPLSSTAAAQTASISKSRAAKKQKKHELPIELDSDSDFGIVAVTPPPKAEKVGIAAGSLKKTPTEAALAMVAAMDKRTKAVKTKKNAEAVKAPTLATGNAAKKTTPPGNDNAAKKTTPPATGNVAKKTPLPTGKKTDGAAGKDKQRKWAKPRWEMQTTRNLASGVEPPTDEASGARGDSQQPRWGRSLRARRLSGDCSSLLRPPGAVPQRQGRRPWQQRQPEVHRGR